MRKGDLRKQEIMDTAEKLFCKNGYEKTSIQDIIDETKSSKGSFYHHFVSKEALLEAICRRRSELIYEDAAAKLDENDSAVENLNVILSGMIPLLDEKTGFLIMLLHIFNLPEGRIIRAGYSEALAGMFLPDLLITLEKGNQTGELFCPDADNSADIILTLVNRLWIRICEQMIDHISLDTESGMSAIVRMVSRYRLAVEQAVLLPYGSVELISIPALRSVRDRIYVHWKQ